MTPPRPSTIPRALVAPRPLAALAVCGALGLGAPRAVEARSNHPSIDTRERAVIHQINVVRKQNGLRALRLAGAISRAADRHSRRQQRTRTLGHQLPGEAPLVVRLSRATRSRPVGEVVFRTSRGARSSAIVAAWMRSAGHRAVLLRRDYKRAGVGIRTGRGGLYVTVDVARR